MKRESEEETFATALNCMDGRVQDAVAGWAREHFNVKYVDAVNEPGIDRLIKADESYPKYVFHTWKEIIYLLRCLLPWNYTRFVNYDICNIPPDCNIVRRKLMISIEGHHSKGVVICGHHNCAGNPVSKEEHHEEVRIFCKEVENNWELPGPVYGLWIDKIDGKWQVAKVVHTPRK